MIRRAIRWIRLVLPPVWVIAFCLLGCFYTGALLLWLKFWLGPQDIREFLVNRDRAAAVCCAVYGVFRIVRFHPLYRPAYRRWLSLTPWTSRRPLPQGPVHLVWQDMLLLGLLIAMLYPSPDAWRTVLLATLFAYLFVLTCSLLFTGQIWIGYAMTFGLALAVRLIMSPAWMLTVLVLLYPLAYVGLRRSLSDFPWRLSPDWEAILAPYTQNAGVRRRWSLGWPFDLLQPTAPEQKAELREAFVLSLLVGWLADCVASIFPISPGEPVPAAIIFYLVALVSISARLLIYCQSRASPISLWGRIWTFRWIVPGYDRVFVAPLCGVLVALFLPTGLGLIGLPITPRYSISAAVVMFVCLAMPPSLRRWQLTGSHRLVSTGRNPKEMQRL